MCLYLFAKKKNSIVELFFIADIVVVVFVVAIVIFFFILNGVFAKLINKQIDKKQSITTNNK